MQDWYSSEWFSWGKITAFEWGRPYMLYLLLGLPILFLIRGFIQNRTRLGLPIAILKGDLKLGWSRHLRFLPLLFIGFSLGLLIIALARPQVSNQTQNRVSEGIDIMLAIDISESMTNKDVLPNRLEASKKVAKNFIKGRYQDRIGIVLFSGEAYSLSPLTTDYEALNDYIDEIKPGLIPAEGTAIGSVLAVSVNRLKEVNSNSKIVILISDGDNTAGNLDPIAAAQLAKVFKVKLYTILVGAATNIKTGETLTNSYSMSIDQQILENIAKTADGKFYRATSQSSLKDIFAVINAAEKVKFLENSSLELIDVFGVYIKWAIVFLLLTFFTKITFLGNILED